MIKRVRVTSVENRPNHWSNTYEIKVLQLHRKRRISYLKDFNSKLQIIQIAFKWLSIHTDFSYILIIRAFFVFRPSACGIARTPGKIEAMRICLEKKRCSPLRYRLRVRPEWPSVQWGRWVPYQAWHKCGQCPVLMRWTAPTRRHRDVPKCGFISCARMSPFGCRFNRSPQHTRRTSQLVRSSSMSFWAVSLSSRATAFELVLAVHLRGRFLSGSTGAEAGWCSRWCRAARGCADRRSRCRDRWLASGACDRPAPCRGPRSACVAVLWAGVEPAGQGLPRRWPVSLLPTFASIT